MTHHTNHDKPVAAGKSSYGLVEAEKIFQLLDLGPRAIFLDLACGRGPYSLHAANLIGPSGMVHAIDLWEEGIALLKEDMRARAITNLTATVADAGKHLPLPDNSLDCCLLASVLHDFIEVGNANAVLSEISRVLRQDGRLGVVEFKVQDGPPGPPKHIRLAPERVIGLLTPFGFHLDQQIEVGPHHYMQLFHIHH